MNINDLPRHPRTGLRAFGVMPSGRVVWPIFGGDESDDAAAQAAAKVAADAAAAAASTGDAGFPANTPLEQMTIDQREAYWKHQSRKHEDRVKAFGGATPEQVTAWRDKAGKHDELERGQMSDRDKAVADAKAEARREALAEATPRAVRAEFRAELKGRVADDKLADRLNTILEPLDLSKFLTDTGDVDTAKVSAFVEGIAPATGTTTRTGPSGGGTGRTGSGSTSGSSVTSGRELFERSRKRSA